MSNVMLAGLVWVAFALHVIAGVTGRRSSGLPLVAWVNLITALCVLAYWVREWVGYVSRGIQWHATDQLVPLYALVVAVVAGLTVAGRYGGSWPNWLFFGINTTVLLAAALFFSFFRMNRLI